MTHCFRSCLLLLVTTSFGATANAQNSVESGATVTAPGSVTLKRQPSQLIMKVDLIARGETLKQALANLEDRRKTAGLLLKTLQATEDSITFGNPTSASPLGQAEQQMQQMISQRISNSGGAVPEGLKLPESVSVSQPVTARWPLTGKDPAALLEESEALQKRINDADLAGVKNQEGISPEQLELMEEAAFSVDPYSGEPETPPGTPQFVFAASLTDKERQAALREAFDKAQRQAAELASAAGLEIAGLASLNQGSSDPSSPSYDDSYSYMLYRRNSELLQQLSGGGMETKNARNISFNVLLAPVSFNFQIQATFRLRPASP